MLGKFIEENSEIVAGKSVIELGCGPGLASIVAAMGGAKSVLATDGDQISVDLTAKNFKLLDDITTCSVETRKLLWGNEEDLSHPLIKKKFDAVLAADVVACPYEKAYDDLLVTLKALVKQDGAIWLCYQQRHVSEQEGFFVRFHDEFNVELVDKCRLHKDFQNMPGKQPIQLFRATLKMKED